MFRYLWLILFTGLVGGTYGFLQGPTAGRAASGAGAFRWSMLWAPEEALPLSERLSPFLGDQLDALFQPLGEERYEPPVRELREIAATLRAEGATATALRRPVYEAALNVCQTVQDAMLARAGADQRFAEASAFNTSFLDPITRRKVSARAFKENQAQTLWTQEAIARRKQIESWITVLLDREKKAGW